MRALRYRQEGKEAAQRGELERSLELFRLAFEIQPSAKLQNRIQRLQEAIQDLAASPEDEAFVNVNNSGLMLYKGLYDKLYEHQKEGVAFLYSLHRDRRKGGILADDMGLGKTIQVIFFLSGMYDTGLAIHTLLVMPTSLIKNWVQEFSKWTPGMRVKEFHGTSIAERNRKLERVQRKGGVVITTYQMLINNWQQLASSARQEFIWDYVILDEGHKIKTSSTKTSKCAHAIPARHRLLLTGTPVQNNLREMWALFDFTCKGSLLGTAKTFKAEYENPITRAREKNATPGEKALGLKISQNLMELIKPYFLRRTKAEVQSRKRVMKRAGDEEEDKCLNAGETAKMPSLTRKNDLIVWTYLSPIQEDIYNQFISLDHIKQLLTTTRSPLAELTVLKKLCDHPRLLSTRAVTQLGLEKGSAANPALEEEEQSESAASRIDHVPDETLVEESGKLRFLVSLLERLREDGHRTLVFSQSRKMLDIMERVLHNRSFQLLRVDGTVTQLSEREKRITLFQTDRRYSIFLLTTQVGGVGLTLTAANRVVIFDPSWNPATDAQAVDRAYRIGQTDNVVIYRLITCGTVEEKIYRRQVFKDSLICQTTGDKKNPFRYFSKQELKELFILEDTRSSSTQQQLQSMHGQHRHSDPALDRHIACLHTMEMFGISDHDLLFSREAGVDAPQDAELHRYIETRVQKAQELVRAESELHGQLLESIAHDTEPAWLARNRDGDEADVRARRAPSTPQSPPPTVDLTQSRSDDPTQSESEQDVEVLHRDGSVEIVAEGGGMETRNESVLSAGVIELSSQPVEENAAAESSRISGCRYHDGESEMAPEDGGTEGRDESVLSAGAIELSSRPVEENAAAESSRIGGCRYHDGESEMAPEDGGTEGRDESVLSAGAIELSSQLVEENAAAESSRIDGCRYHDGESEMAPEDWGTEGRDESVLSAGAIELSSRLVEENAAAESSRISGRVLAVGDNVALLAESCSQDLKEQHPDPKNLYPESGESSMVLTTSIKAQLLPQHFSLLGQLDSSKALLGAELDASVASVEAEPFQGNFNLQLDDSADMFEEGEEKSSMDEEGFLLQMEVSGSELNEAAKLENTSPCGSPVMTHSIVSMSADDSLLCLGSRKKRAQVIYDSEEDELKEEEAEKPCLASSPLASSFRSSSTPKSILTSSAPRRHGMNTSVAARRSFVESLLEDLEEEEIEEEEDCSSDGAELSQTSEASGTSVDESVEEEKEEGCCSSGGMCLSQASNANGTSVDESVEEEEVNGEMLSSENTGEEVTCEEHESEEGEEEQSAFEESTGNVELDSSEAMEQFAPVPTPETCLQLVSPSESTVEVPQEPEETYEALVHSGKRCLAEGKKKQALDLFLKAIDINSGDGEVQLLIIQLYRILSQPRS
ncbi:hypothetical protein P4O66_015963 [Electrophorus voltai]|uniref:DNA excision repair protein ERCC-6-like n=1 Tax=Electrophorus voltai TaxID=2609070 RepID=A0AAD9DPL8_9TELE|nr:hypothetical protein P4O66_015963 [Electrophorus voltai]